MKQGMIFHQYIWIINTLRKSGGLTFEELKQKWVEDRVANGNVLQRSSFNRHREAILSMFGIVIDCNLQTYKYYIGNEEVLQDDSIEQWLFYTYRPRSAVRQCCGEGPRGAGERAAGTGVLEHYRQGHQDEPPPAHRLPEVWHGGLREDGVSLCAEVVPPALVPAGEERRGADARVCPRPHERGYAAGRGVRDA